MKESCGRLFFFLIGDLRQKKEKKRERGLGRLFLLIVPLQYFLKRDLFFVNLTYF